MGRINIELDEDIHRKAKAHCALEGITLARFVEQSLRNKVEKENAV